jgi:general secretion pathway protein D
VIDPDAPVVNSIEYRDTGVILEVAPRVNAGGMVVFDIRQEVSDVVETTTSTLDSPTIRQRQIESAVAIKSGRTTGFGGLIRRTQRGSATDRCCRTSLGYVTSSRRRATRATEPSPSCF